MIAARQEHTHRCGASRTGDTRTAIHGLAFRNSRFEQGFQGQRRLRDFQYAPGAAAKIDSLFADPRQVR
jgi:hypothetical protein